MSHALTQRSIRSREEASEIVGQQPDPLRRVVHLVLGVYLAPVFLVVLVVGGLAIAINSLAVATHRVGSWLRAG